MADSKAIAVPNLIDDEDKLRDIVDFDSAMRALETSGISVQDITDFGTGFAPVNKATLVGVPFVMLGHKLVNGTYGEMAVLFVVTQDNAKGIIVDGSSGIYEQVKSYMSRGLSGALLVKRGLTRSDYEYEDEKGNKIPATTFYLSE